jgi:hypothetical protein
MPNADQNDRDYRVGRCKPPIHSRFRKGQSGNPKGRPPGSRDTATLLGEELDAVVSVTEYGGRKKLTKRAVMVKQLVNKAGSGNLRACEIVLKMENQFKRRDPTGDSVEGSKRSEGHNMLTIEYLRECLEEHEPELTSRKNPDADSGGKDEPH